MAESYRVTFAPGTHGQLSNSVVVKVPSQSESSRGASRVTRCYELETSFYATLQQKVGVHAPTCMHVWYDATDDDFVLVLEDIIDAAQGDQLQGATMEQASAAVQQLVALHASLWDSPVLDTITWANRHSFEGAAGTRDLLRKVFDGFALRFADLVQPEVMQLGKKFVQQIDGYDAAFPKNHTIIHRDLGVTFKQLLFHIRHAHFDALSKSHPELSKIERLHQSGFQSYASFHLAHKANP